MSGLAKRIMDVVLSGLAMVILGPLLIALGILVRIKLGAPVFFRQERPGLAEKPFNIFKFRTMAEKYGPDGQALPDEQRMTRLGTMMRRLSLDELPELVNVFRGEMSLVGPRPLLMEYLPLYSDRQRRRHLAKPGLTGWAQVNGRNALSWEEKFDLDIWYVDHRSIWLDLKIIALTIKMLFLREGIEHGSHVTMPRFNGSKDRD